MRRWFTTAGFVGGWVLLTGGAVRSAETADLAAVEFFETSIRPVLSARCLKCHGPSAQKAGLRLDSRAAVLQGGETGPAAVPGDPAGSLLVEAVNYGESVQMPPKSRLPAAEVAALTRWVALGLPWPAGEAPKAATAAVGGGFDLKARRAAHWAWKPVAAQTPPPVRDAGWPLDPVDRFLLARLEAKGLRPAPDADRRALLRRLSFDLTGLPPTPEDVRAFAADPAPDAVDRLVDRLLSSPRFGERWGRHWLDLVRYAETHGHEFDPPIANAYQYRDYVVRALNADVPYDRFLTEHIAGDLADPPRLDPATGADESVLGTGFWFLGEEVHSPVDIRQDECDRLDNRLDVMTKTFLGLTVACARCHDHKFDAISQKDYYALSGFLLSSGYRQARFATAPRERRAAETLRAARDASRRRVLAIAARAWKPVISGTSHGPSLPESLVDDLARSLGREGAPVPAPSGAGSGRLVVDFGRVDDLARLQDGFAFGLRPARPGDLIAGGDDGPPTVKLVTRASARRDPAFRRLPLAAGTERDHGRLGEWDRAGQTLRTPEFTVGSGRLWYLARGAGRAFASVNAHTLVAGPLHARVFTEWTDGGKGWRWVVHDLTDYKGHRVHVEFSPPGKGDLEIARVVEADARPGPESSPVGDAAGLAAEAVRRMESDTIAGADAPEEVARAADWLLQNLARSGPAGVEAREEIAAEAAQLRDTERTLARQVAAEAPAAPAMVDGTGVNERLLIRGSSRTPGPEVPRRFLEAVSKATTGAGPEGGSGRLELARQMLDPADPFARRVIVNRVWHHLFGRGIVGSVDNFGVLGEPPTHPELLDYLADRFVRDGWSLKRLIRALVLTHAYRTASRPDAAADGVDPNNLLLHRMPVRRLEAEPIRDAILAVSGRLDGRMGGPSVPVHLTAFMQGRGRPAKSGPADGDGRRSLYLAIRRNFLAPMMQAFDAPIPFSTVGRRNVSNVPAQALILMNDPFVANQAGLWADRVLAAPGGNPEGRVAAMYMSAFARSPDASEVTDALAFLEAQGRERGSGSDAWRDDRRVWADLAHVLFNAKEFVFLD